MIEINLPWPHTNLSPNTCVHYMTKARAKKKARADAHLLASVARRVNGWTLPEAGELDVVLTFHPPCNRRRDKDNLLASMKAPLDGMAAALGVDDSRFDPRPIIGAVDERRLGFVHVAISPKF